MATFLSVVVVALFVISATASLAGKCIVTAQVRHVVGGDPGWDPSSDIAAWSSGRVFRVGDEICECFLFI